MRIISIFAVFLCAIISISSCSKKNDIVSGNAVGPVTIEFEHVVNNSPLSLNNTTYINNMGEDFTISTFKYYVSNFKFTSINGEEIIIPESYFLIDESKPESKIFDIKNLSVGDYSKVEFIIGVDYDRNFAGAQTGALDPIHGMFWTWNSGYIFLKLEGKSSFSTLANNEIQYHIGGVLSPNNTIKSYIAEINSVNPLRVRTDKKPNIHFIVNASKLFSGQSDISFNKLNGVMGGPNAVLIAENYVNGLFRLDHIHN